MKSLNSDFAMNMIDECFDRSQAFMSNAYLQSGTWFAYEGELGIVIAMNGEQIVNYAGVCFPLSAAHAGLRNTIDLELQQN